MVKSGGVAVSHNFWMHLFPLAFCFLRWKRKSPPSSLPDIPTIRNWTVCWVFLQSCSWDSLQQVSLRDSQASPNTQLSLPTEATRLPLHPSPHHLPSAAWSKGFPLPDNRAGPMLAERRTLEINYLLVYIASCVDEHRTHSFPQESSVNSLTNVMAVVFKTHNLASKWK